MPKVATSTTAPKADQSKAQGSGFDDYLRRNPDVAQLASAASLARSIEPELLRSLRLGLNSQLMRARVTVAAESALWFSGLVESRGADAITLLPAALQELRPRLLADRELLECARGIVADAHKLAPDVLQWEERIVYFALTGQTALLEEEARRGVRSISRGTRHPLVNWITAMWHRLPPAACESRLMLTLYQFASGMALQRVSGGRTAEMGGIDLTVDFASLPVRELGVVFRDGRFVIGVVPEAEYGIEVPDREPVMLEVLSGRRSRSGRPVAIARGERMEVGGQERAVRIRTLAGHIHELEPAFFRPPAKRFRVAFAFVEEKREFVKGVAEVLAECFGEEKILYDRFHEMEFAAPNLGIKQRKLYSEQSELFVPVMCEKYDKKRWVLWEQRAFRVLLSRRPKEVLIGFFDRVDRSGLPGGASFIKLDDKTPHQFARLILERLAVNEGLDREYLTKLFADKLVPQALPIGQPRSVKSFGKAENSQPLNEVKLILLGRGGAGKTSTVRALQGLSFGKNEGSTTGIALSDLVLGDCKGGPVTAHVWDFAGQVITHALHQFFFSVRSVYVLVLSGRENNEREDAEYWLRLIRAFGTDEDGKGPPVIVVLNHWDVPGCRPKVDRFTLQERYPFIAEFVEMDCATRKGVAQLKMTLCKEVDKLKWIREPLKPEWVAVRNALAAAGKERQALSYAEYRALCASHGVTNIGEQDSLSEFLHNLGAALNYRNDPRLRQVTVLQPLWLTKNVYGLVRQAEKQSGVLKQADVDAVLAQEKDASMRMYLVQIMERFEIAYVPRSSSGGMWLVPQALPISQPRGLESFAKKAEATHLRYTYEALPEGLVPRAIVRLHEFIEEANGKPQQWASGAVLTREGARALLRAETPQQVMITVTGPAKARQQLAGLCQAEIRDINAEIRGLNPLEETKVQGAWVSTAILSADERNRRQTGVPVPSQGTVMIDPKEPSDEYTTLPARQKEIWKPTVFISYSKDNLAQRKRLESELKILHNEGLLERHWHDRMIDPGDERDEKIQRELREADVILILASAAALATDYITQHEIPKALELHAAGETIVVPIVLESCRWEKTALGRLNALPERAKPLNKWRPVSKGWHSVANGLAHVLEKLMKQGHKRANFPIGENS